MVRTLVISAIALAVAASAASASGVIGVTDRAGGTQIWIDSAAFDSQSGFTLDASVADLTQTGTGYYYPAAGGYAQYSLDFSSPDLAGIDPNGTWTYYGRAWQPSTGTPGPDAGSPKYVESDWLYVKNDPGDGTGATWVADAQASQNAGDDRVFQDIYYLIEQQAGFPDDTDFVWLSTFQSGSNVYIDVTKEFIPDGDVVTWRLEPREPGDYNARLDVMVWSTVSYIPTDEDYWYAVKLPGDANLDGTVDDADYTVWADNYNGGTTWEEGDFNDDGNVDDADYTIWADNYGSSAVTPEPISLAMMGLGSMWLLRRRR